MMILFSGSIGALRPYGIEQDSPEYDEWITSLYKKYFQSGATYVKTDTFNVNYNTFKDRFSDVMKHRLDICKTFHSSGNFIFDIGPLGILLEPYGSFSRETAVRAFKCILQYKPSNMKVLFETFTDLTELRLALLACGSYDFPHSDIFVSMSFEANGKTISGDTLEAYVNLCHTFKVGAIGINCNLTVKEMIPLMRRLRELAGPTHIFAQPNKSHPHSDGSYDDVNWQDMAVLAGLCDCIGGCCGFNPSDIDHLYRMSKVPSRFSYEPLVSIYPSSNTTVLDLPRPIICGDRLNVYGSKKFRELLKARDFTGIVEMASEQIKAGADILDICVDTGNEDLDADMMKQVLLHLSYLDVPVQIDTQEYPVINAGLTYSKGVPIINSLKPSYTEDAEVLSFKGGCLVIIQSFEDKVDTSKGSRATIKMPDCLIQDLQTLSITEGHEYADETISLMYQSHRTMIGLTNISYGLPNRSNINAAYLIRCLEANPFLIMCNVNDPIVGPIYKAWLYQRGYISSDAYVGVQHTDLVTLYDYVVAGVTPSDSIPFDMPSIINALDEVGHRYESHTYYVPQLIASANVAKSLLNKHYATSSISVNASIIIATVKGDIHDIGKNIVKAVAQAHGFSILDLGYDVAPETIVSHITSDTKVVALSGLITNSLKSMRDTITAVKAIRPDIACVIGGAVVDNDIASSMGAIYGETPIDFVNICKSILKEN